MSTHQTPLFDEAEISLKAAELEDRRPRILEPQRAQGEMRFEMPDAALPDDHPARAIWNILGTLELSRFSDGCTSVEGKAGRSLLSPRMMLTLWLYAISRAIGSAREIARLTRTDVAFSWIVGDLGVSHHKLSQFRVGHGEALDELMTEVLAVLLQQGLITLETVAQDGTRTRAAASAPSFRSYGSLLECREQAALHLKAVLAAADDPEYTRAQHAARAAAAKDYQDRVEAAIQTVAELQQQRGSSSKVVRASTTDAEARVMKMGDGGFRPAYNVQYATEGSELGGPRTIVGVEVSNDGSDMGKLTPMAEQIEKRCGRLPEEMLADGGYAKHEDIAALRQKGVDALVSPSSRAKSIEQLQRDGADPEVIAWREQMETPEAKKRYRARAGLAELPNAHQKTHHGIQQVLVRGLEKVTCVVLLNAIASNILQHAAHWPM
jgi:transposase